MSGLHGGECGAEVFAEWNRGIAYDDDRRDAASFQESRRGEVLRKDDPAVVELAGCREAVWWKAGAVEQE